MSGMPLQTGDPAVEGAGGTVEMIGRQRAHKRLLKTLEEEVFSVTFKEPQQIMFCFLSVRKPGCVN